MPTLRLAMKTPKRADVWICPPLGVSLLCGLWVHVCMVCSQVRVCHAQCLAVLSVFMFLGCCFFLFGLICSDFLIHCVFWSCSSFPFLFVIAVFESCRRRCFSHQNYADPMPVRSRVISVRQPLVPRALQRVCPTAFKGRLKSQLIHTTHFPH